VTDKTLKILLGKEVAPKNLAWVRGYEGLAMVNADTLSADNKGYFEGKQGTTRRSRKGRTWIAPNGTRKFFMNHGSNVVGYPAAKIVK